MSTYSNNQQSYRLEKGQKNAVNNGKVNNLRSSRKVVKRDKKVRTLDQLKRQYDKKLTDFNSFEEFQDYLNEQRRNDIKPALK